MCLFANFTYGQSLLQITIYKKSRDIKNGGYVIDSIKKLRINEPYAGCVSITTIRGKTYIYNKDSIWGYKINDGLYRMANTDIKIIVVDDIIIYHARGPKEDIYFFSRNLNSRIYNLNRYNIHRAYKSDTAFLKGLKQNLKWPENILKKDNKTGQFKIIEIYKQTHAHN